MGKESSMAFEFVDCIPLAPSGEHLSVLCGPQQ